MRVVMITGSARLLGVLALWLGLAACGDGGGEKGEACSVAADCADTLVCALTADGAETSVCADYRDTYPETLCNPGADLTMPCGVVLKRAAGESCTRASQCKSETCAPGGDGGTVRVCSP